MLRRLIRLAASRVANDPKMRAKAGEVVDEYGRPFVEKKMADLRDVARTTNPRKRPIYFAGRALRRLIGG